jgi:hypothetical protein
MNEFPLDLQSPFRYGWREKGRSQTTQPALVYERGTYFRGTGRGVQMPPGLGASFRGVAALFGYCQRLFNRRRQPRAIPLPTTSPRCVTGLTKTQAEDLLDCLEAHGIHNCKIAYQEGQGFSVRDG